MEDSMKIPFYRSLSPTISLHQIEWWRPASRFVVLRYSRGGHVQEFGKRLDLDKRVFLDGFDDDFLDVTLGLAIPEIMRAVADYRNGSSEARESTTNTFA